MNEQDIRNQIFLLAKAVHENQEDMTNAAAFMLLAQFLVDINRIATVLENPRSPVSWLVEGG